MSIVDDDMKELSTHSLLLESLNANSSEVAVLPADVAWADSCLVKDMGVSNTNWSSMKEALMEILTTQTGPLNSSSSQSGRRPSDNEILIFPEDLTNPECSGTVDADKNLIFDDIGDVDIIEVSGDDEDVILLGKKNSRGRGRNRLENVFRQNYTEDMEYVGRDLDLSLTTYLVEPSAEEIFKVWDVGFSDDFDDFLMFEEAIAEFPPQIQSDNPTTQEDSMCVDDLIAGVGHLSLTQHTS